MIPFLALATAACPPAALAPGQDPVDALHAELVAWINAKDATSLYARFGTAMQAALPLPATEGFLDGILGAGGCIASSTRVSGSPANAVYLLTAATRRWQLDLTVDARGLVQGMTITDPAPPDPPVVRSTLALQFPVEGAWTVFWGGATPELNAHVSNKSQRRAADLLIVDADGRSHAGDGSKLTDYYAYGKQVRAAAAGTVVTAIDGVPESKPGRPNPYFALGNAVIIDHGGTYSVVAHLQAGSLKVKVGAQVRADQVLGLCGNTGNSTEPHLHFQLMDGPAFEAAYGVEAVFTDVQAMRDGKPVPAGEYVFRKGDVVTRRAR